MINYKFQGFVLFLISIYSVFAVDIKKTSDKTLTGLSSISNILKNVESKVNQIDAAVSSVENSGAYRTLVDGNSISFPYGILPDNGDKKYALIVQSVKLDVTKGMTAQICMKIPFRSNESLYFLADEVSLSTNGKITGDFKLYLLNTTSFKFGKGYSLKVNGLGAGTYDSTYVTFNCRGFKDITLNGSLDFDPETIVWTSYKKQDKLLSGGFIIDIFQIVFHLCRCFVAKSRM